jgi:RNA polymerase sigma factor (TIGR02999 family)
MSAAPSDHPVTQLLQAAAGGEGRASAELLPLVYDELRRLADSQLRKAPPGHTLQPTALVHEAYLRLVGSADPGWQGRGHFFFAAARAMHDILVEHARRKLSLKRGGGRKRMDPSQVTLAVEVPPDEMLALSESLQRLEKREPRKHQIVLLRFFAGMTNEEAAEMLGVTTRTVERDWRFARAWLHRELAEA